MSCVFQNILPQYQSLSQSLQGITAQEAKETEQNNHQLWTYSFQPHNPGHDLRSPIAFMHWLAVGDIPMPQYNRDNWDSPLSYCQYFFVTINPFTSISDRNRTKYTRRWSDSTADKAASHVWSRTFLSKRNGWIASYLAQEETPRAWCGCTLVSQLTRRVPVPGKEHRPVCRTCKKNVMCKGGNTTNPFETLTPISAKRQHKVRRTRLRGKSPRQLSLHSLPS